MTYCCMNCVGEKAIPGSKLCKMCYDAQNNELTHKVRDIETYTEDRLSFLYRKSKEIGLNHSRKHINKMITAGMTDDLILKTKPDILWTYGSPEV